ncbi:hypothetical protein ABBQ32_006717 [Trebouxia sp. C0010 RCD-2024]
MLIGSGYAGTAGNAVPYDALRVAAAACTGASAGHLVPRTHLELSLSLSLSLSQYHRNCFDCTLAAFQHQSLECRSILGIIWGSVQEHGSGQGTARKSPYLVVVLVWIKFESHACRSIVPILHMHAPLLAVINLPVFNKCVKTHFEVPVHPFGTRCQRYATCHWSHHKAHL